MIDEPRLVIDDRDARDVFATLLRRRLGYVPEWLGAERDPATALARIVSRYAEAVARRLNQAPDKNKLAFLDLLALGLVPAQAARAPVMFTLASGAANASAPAGTQVAAPPPPGGTSPLVFETETGVAIAKARLVEAVSLWPGRDQYIDHTAALVGGTPFTPFEPLKLTDTPHVVYVAHDILCAFAGPTTLEVGFDLSQSSQEELTLRWEYWDGDVWRRFKDVRRACAPAGGVSADSTAGLTESGRYLLEADCAESIEREVNGAKKFWIRGVLDEPLTPATGENDRLLPEVESVTLSSMITRPLAVQCDVKYGHVYDFYEFFGLSAPDSLSVVASAVAPRHAVRVVTESGEYLPGVVVTVVDRNGTFVQQRTTAPGEPYLAFYPAIARLGVTVAYLGETLDVADIVTIPALLTAVLVTVRLKSLALDEAFADAAAIDLSKPFYPFGLQPGPGSTFYFTSEEIFSKPGAEFRLYFTRTASPQDAIELTTTPLPGLPATLRTELRPTVAWEYWNGREWSALLAGQVVTMNQTGALDLKVPDDFEPVKVNDKEARWMRARIVSGSFGFTQSVLWPAGTVTNQHTFVITKPPVLSSIAVGYSWRYGPFPPEQVLTYNDFRYADRTFEARWPGATFPVFERVADTTPALYLGFDDALPVDRLGVFIDVREDAEASRPPLVWEYWNAAEWRALSFDDETQALRVPGVLNVTGPEDGAPLARFGQSRHWLRGRLKEDGPPGEPVIERILTNVAWATEQRTLRNVPLGASAGTPGQRLSMTQSPVLDGEVIEVREAAGPRAAIEWRILAMELPEGGDRLVRDLEEQLAREGPQFEVQSDRVRLVRNSERQVTEVWIAWEARAHLLLSGASDRHYAIDRARGIVVFGDGVKGRIPPSGALVRAASFRTGGGSAGNVAAKAIAQLLGPLAGVQAVSNPKPAEGGADRETMEGFRSRGPRTIRHRGRAVSAADYETLAREASPAVRFARAIPRRSESGRPLPGWITLIILPESADPRPYPTFGLRRHVREFLTRRAPADVAAISRIHVTGPRFFAVDVSATLAPKDATDVGPVERRVREAIERFLHPLRGGPERRGWDLGRDVYLSDLAVVIEQTPGVDYVEELALLVGGVPQGEQVAIAADRMVVSGNIRVRMKAPERQRALALSASGAAR